MADVASPFVPLMDEGKLLDDLTKDFKRLQKQKNREKGGVEARVLQSRAFKWGEQYVTQSSRGLVAEVKEDNRLHLVFNVIEKLCQKLTGRLTSIGGQYGAKPDKKDPQSLAYAEVADKLILSLDEKLEQPTVMWQLVDTLLTDGVAFIHTPWVPDSQSEAMPQFTDEGELLFTFDKTGEQVPEGVMNQLVESGIPPEQFTIYEEVVQTGDVGCDVFGALNVFVDQGVKSIAKLAPDQAVYIAEIKTQGWIEENYPETGMEINYDPDMKIVTTNFFQEGATTASLYLKDLIPQFQGTLDLDDPKMAVVVHRYLPQSRTNPNGRYTCFIPSKVILFDGENPYGEIPLIDFHLGPVTSTFWTKDYVTDIIAPQKFLNKRLSQMGEQANAAIADKLALGGSLAAKDIIPDAPQVVEKAINSENGALMMARVPAPQLPSWFLEATKMVSGLAMQIGGGSDLMEEGQFPGQLRGPMALPLLQEILDSQWGPLYMHIGQQMAKVHQQRLNRVKQFYEPVRTLHYTDKNQRDEVLQFHTDKILRSGVNYTITVERSSLLPEFKALKEARVRERLQSPLGIMYMDERTGGLDKSKIAADMSVNDWGRDTKEASSRKFAQQLIERLWKGEPAPPVMQFWDHEPMLDELESEMMTTEWLSASPQVQQLFIDRWNQHSFFLQQRAEMQQQMQMSRAIQQSVAQATQQAAAMAAADTVHSTQEQMRAQSEANQANPIEQMLRARESQNNGSQEPNRGPANVNSQANRRPGGEVFGG